MDIGPNIVTILTQHLKLEWVNELKFDPIRSGGLFTSSVGLICTRAGQFDSEFTLAEMFFLATGEY